MNLRFENQENNQIVNQFETIYKKHYSLLCCLAYQYLKDRELAEEIVQELFQKVWEQSLFVGFEGSFAGYLVVSIKNSCINTIRRQKMIQTASSRILEDWYQDSAKNDQPFSDMELKSLIKTTIEKMPSQRKKVFILSREIGMKYKEIAQYLGISEKTVEVHMGLALKFLRTELKEFFK